MRPEPSRDALLDLLRALSIISVVLFHVLQGIMRFAPARDVPGVVERIPGWMNFAWQPLAVDVIFLVSAYLLTRGLFADLAASGRVDLRGYAVRRLSRIIPLYYLAILVFGLSQGSDWADMALAALFVEFLLTGEQVVPVGWSMEVMILVYLALPAIATLLWRLRRPLLWVGLAAVLSTAVRALPLLGKPEVAAELYTHLLDRGAIHPEAVALYFKPWFRLTPFLLGIGLAVLADLRPQAAQRLRGGPGQRAALWAGVAGLLWATLFWPLHDAGAWVYAVFPPAFWQGYWTVNTGLFSLAIAAMILLAEARPLPFARFWASISERIMGIYLFHFPMILIGAVLVFRSDDEAVLGQATTLHVWAVFAVALPLSYGVSALLHRWFERPIQQALRRRLT